MEKTKKNKTIIITSIVSYGYVGNNIMSPLLEMNGFGVISIPTVIYSNHHGYPTVKGGSIPSTIFSDIFNAITKLDILDEVSTIITGYIGSAQLVEIIAEFISAIKKIDPNITYLCDPVMGDFNKGLYVPEHVPFAIKKYLIPLADLLIPNHFEMELISGNVIRTADILESSIRLSFNTSEQKIITTGCQFNDTRKDVIENCIMENDRFYTVRSKKINLNPNGTGDLFASHIQLMRREKTLHEAVMLSGDILTSVLYRMYNEGRNQFELTDILFSMNILKAK